MNPNPTYLANAARHMATLERDLRCNKAVLKCRLRELRRAGEDLRSHRTLLQDHGYLFDVEATLFERDVLTVRFELTVRSHNDLTILESEAMDIVHDLRRIQHMILWEIEGLKKLMEGNEANWVYSHCSSSLFWLCVKIICDPTGNSSN
ncbi:uncharacterized protein H6S33_008133 [Morchella sextelata]|jgi:hypothetical protein|uniref:uncharacterized protein n=1 Tax=Morchella sextelata TaxID=1174677 RepID=UPI001D05738B|nr:uncharacterized protein H6S33_008133 [Morchella sextelata]KAH0603129.1 hypothetical protein H6S33_008133 [Morchella sextelata]